MFRLLVLLICFLFAAVSCQPMKLASVDAEDEDSSSYDRFDFSSSALLDDFESDKLDLVFVLDTGPNMKGFYQKSPFKANFLSRFQAYDWRFAYTDMSVDASSFNQQDGAELTLTEEEEGGETCGFFSGLFLTVAGLFVSGPELTGLGLGHLAGCGEYVSEIFEGEDPADSFANGAFLPFEHEGEKLENLAYLTRATKNTHQIFDHSTRLSNLKKGEGSYNAPQVRNSPSYPFLSLLLSLSHKEAEEEDAILQEEAKATVTKTSPQNKDINGSFYKRPKATVTNEISPQEDTEESGQQKGFFREDSSIVYVLLAGEDLKMEVSTEHFKESLELLFGPERRLKVILLLLSENSSSIFCQLNSGQVEPLPSPGLKKLAQDMGWTVLDLCSKNLPERLFDEISSSLYPSLNLLSIPSLDVKEDQLEENKQNNRDKEEI